MLLTACNPQESHSGIKFACSSARQWPAGSEMAGNDCGEKVIMHRNPLMTLLPGMHTLLPAAGKHSPQRFIEQGHEEKQ